MYTGLTELQLLLFRAGTQKVGAIATMAVCHGDCSRLFPMVLLGLLSSLFAQGWKVYWFAG